VQSGAHRLRQEQLARQAPELADLLGAMVASGATSTGALRAAALAIGEPARTTLAPVVAALDLGAAPADAWAPAAVGPLAPIAGCFSRSASTGAPMMSVLAGVAADLRRKHRLAVEVRARAAGVRAVAPLAACFLPAFLLVGVAPIVASLASGLLG
jgi:Flp pilus assembly protein TadB